MNFAFTRIMKSGINGQNTISSYCAIFLTKSTYIKIKLSVAGRKHGLLAGSRLEINVDSILPRDWLRNQKYET